MPVPRLLLLNTLENLGEKDFKKLKWFLTQEISESWKPIPLSRLEKASETETVSLMIQTYCEDPAVRITVEILREMGHEDAADKLEKKHKGGETAAPSTSSAAAPAPAAPAAPAKLTATDGGVIFAPAITGGATGTWNITFNK